MGIGMDQYLGSIFVAIANGGHIIDNQYYIS